MSCLELEPRVGIAWKSATVRGWVALVARPQEDGWFRRWSRGGGASRFMGGPHERGQLAPMAMLTTVERLPWSGEIAVAAVQEDLDLPGASGGWRSIGGSSGVWR